MQDNSSGMVSPIPFYNGKSLKQADDVFIFIVKEKCIIAAEIRDFTRGPLLLGVVRTVPERTYVFCFYSQNVSPSK